MSSEVISCSTGKVSLFQVQVTELGTTEGTFLRQLYSKRGPLWEGTVINWSRYPSNEAVVERDGPLCRPVQDHSSFLQMSNGGSTITINGPWRFSPMVRSRFRKPTSAVLRMREPSDGTLEPSGSLLDVISHSSWATKDNLCHKYHPKTSVVVLRPCSYVYEIGERSNRFTNLKISFSLLIRISTREKSDSWPWYPHRVGNRC